MKSDLGEMDRKGVHPSDALDDGQEERLQWPVERPYPGIAVEGELKKIVWKRFRMYRKSSE
jgi:hypothetical protein